MEFFIWLGRGVGDRRLSPYREKYDELSFTTWPNTNNAQFLTLIQEEIAKAHFDNRQWTHPYDICIQLIPRILPDPANEKTVLIFQGEITSFDPAPSRFKIRLAHALHRLSGRQFTSKEFTGNHSVRDAACPTWTPLSLVETLTTPPNSLDISNA